MNIFVLQERSHTNAHGKAAHRSSRALTS